MDKYRDVPIISADDDCIYTCNYAQELYDEWIKDNNSVYSFHICKFCKFQHGPTTIYPPNKLLVYYGLKCITPEILNTNHDDVYYGCLLNRLNIQIKEIKDKVCYIFHDTINPLSGGISLETNKAIEIVYEQLDKFISL